MYIFVKFVTFLNLGMMEHTNPRIRVECLKKIRLDDMAMVEVISLVLLKTLDVDVSVRKEVYKRFKYDNILFDSLSTNDKVTVIINGLTDEDLSVKDACVLYL